MTTLTTRDANETPPEFAAGADPWDLAGEPGAEVEGLHFGLAWHRYRYCFRQATALRVLIVGCGAGLQPLWAARLNPGARVLAIDPSAGALAAARERARGVDVDATLDFRVHDPSEPLPVGWGRFDFVVCRGVLGPAADPAGVLANLARALDPRGLLAASVPSHAGRQVARSFRRAVETLTPAGSGAVERAEVGLDLLLALRPDHPIRAHVAWTQHDVSDPEVAARVVADYLDGRHDWTLDGAADLLSAAGLKFLYAATPWRWRPDRVFATDALPGRFADRVDRLAPDRLSRLIETLDPTLLGDLYQAHACPSDYDPPAPDWPSSRREVPGAFDRLVPRRTGLAEVSRGLPSGSQGRVTYRTVSGTLGELDRWSHLIFEAVDGSSSCGMIERKLASRTRASDDPLARQERWIGLADLGLILLKPHDDL